MAGRGAARDHRDMFEKPSGSRRDVERVAALAADRSSAQPTVAVAPYDCVDDCGDASFPASDPPSWWSGR